MARIPTGSTPHGPAREEEGALSKEHTITIRRLPIPEAGLPDELNAAWEKCILTGAITPVRAIWGLNGISYGDR